MLKNIRIMILKVLSYAKNINKYENQIHSKSEHAKVIKIIKIV